MSRRDVEARQAEEKMRRSEERLRQGVRVAQLGLFEHDHRTDEIYYSPLLRQICGWTAHEPVTMAKIIAAVAPEDRPAFAAAVQRAHDPAGDGLFSTDHRIIRPDGGIRWVSARAQTTFEGAGAARRPVRTLGALMDITERKEAEAALAQLNATLEQQVTERTQALRKSEAALIQAQHLAAFGNWRWDLQTNRHFWSEEIYRIYGRDPTLPPAVYPEVREYFTPASWELLAAAVERALAEGVAYDCDAEVARPDGTRRWITARGAATRDPGGRIINLHGTVQDITARKQAEEALRESQERLKLAQMSAGAGMWDWDIPGGRLIWSDELFGLFGLDATKTSASFEAWRNVVHPEDMERAHERIEQAVRDGTPLDSEYRIKLPSGEARWIKALGRSQYGPSHQPLRMTGICLDVTPRKRAEEALRDSELRIRLFVQHTPAAVAMFDRQMHYLIHSRRWLEDYRLGDRDLTGLSHYDVFPELPDTIKEVHQRCLAGEVQRAEEDSFARADGRVDWVRWECCPWRNASGEIGGIILFTEVINERKQAELALKELNETLEQRVAERTAALRQARDELEQRVAERTAELARTNERLTAEIAERAALQEELVAASERERERLGQNLHDGLCQILTAARFKTDSLLTRLEDDSPCQRSVKSIASLVVQAVDEARDLARGLEPVEALPEGLMDALQRLASTTCRLFNLACTCEFPRPVLIANHKIATELFRIAQEATNNAIKHSCATEIRLRLVNESAQTVLTVTSNGKAFPRSPHNSGMGLKTMRFRAGRIGADLKIGRGQGGGTVVSCSLPNVPNEKGFQHERS